MINNINKAMLSQDISHTATHVFINDKDRKPLTKKEVEGIKKKKAKLLKNNTVIQKDNV